MGGRRFWRNVVIIGGVHLALFAGLIRWSGAARQITSQQVVWLSGDEPAGSAGVAKRAVASATPTPEPDAGEIPESEEQQSAAPLKSDIQLPTPTPSATATPIPMATPRVRPSTTPKPLPIAKASPKPTAKPKKVITRSTPKPKRTPAPADEHDADDSDVDAARETVAKLGGAAHSSGGGHGNGGSTRASEVQWYGRMLHDRFHNAWDQPTSVVTTGAKMSAVAKVRIEKDGRVSRFEVVKPSGNVVVDESVRAVAGRVTQVDPLPNGVGSGAHYDVTINFELNPED